jgi:CheY-like chemotaxis protein
MSKKILIADQSETVRGIAESLFRKEGFEVVSASDGVEALELIRTAGVDLAFLNSGLPEIDGYLASRQIKSDEKTRGVKVVLLLSTSEIVDQRNLLSSLADDTLNKPFSPQDLIEMTSSTLGIEVLEKEGSVIDAEESKAIGDDVEEISLDEQTDSEVDFSSIFGEEKPSEDGSALDAVFLPEAYGDDSSDHRASGSPAVDSEKEDKGKSDMPEKTTAESEETIRLAEDQYDLEAARPEAEIEPPHDYNWFIREMKKDLTKTKSDKVAVDDERSSTARNVPPGETATAVPGKPGRHAISSSQFDIEEIGTTKIYVADEKSDPDSERNELVAAGAQADHGIESADLSLAEKLLVKELAGRIAERLVSRISSAELRQILVDALSSLKKM